MNFTPLRQTYVAITACLHFLRLTPAVLDIPEEIGSDNPELTIVTAALSPNGPCPPDRVSTPSDSTYSPNTLLENVMTPDGFDLGDLPNA